MGVKGCPYTLYSLGDLYPMYIIIMGDIFCATV